MNIRIFILIVFYMVTLAAKSQVSPGAGRLVADPCQALSQPRGFVQAFDSMHQIFSRYYPFTRWKSIDWNAVNAWIRPMILAASASGDSAAFCIALKSYYDFTHDGHVGFRHGV